MHIAVTGAAGSIGRYVVRDLLAAGHSVQGIDAVAVSGLQVDLTDAGQVYGALSDTNRAMRGQNTCITWRITSEQVGYRRRETAAHQAVAPVSYTHLTLPTICSV